jgi:hypothetical protein
VSLVLVVVEGAVSVVAVDVGLVLRVLVIVGEVDVVVDFDPAGSAGVTDPGAGLTPGGDVGVPVLRPLSGASRPPEDPATARFPSGAPAADTSIVVVAGTPGVLSPRATGAGGIMRPKSRNPMLGR